MSEDWETLVAQPALALEDTMRILSDGLGSGLVGFVLMWWCFALANFSVILNPVYLEAHDRFNGNPVGQLKSTALDWMFLMAMLPLLVCLDLATTSSRCDELLSTLNRAGIKHGERCYHRIAWLKSRLRQMNSDQGMGFLVGGAMVLDRRSLSKLALAVGGGAVTVITTLLALSEDAQALAGGGASNATCALCADYTAIVKSFSLNSTCSYNMSIDHPRALKSDDLAGAAACMLAGEMEQDMSPWLVPMGGGLGRVFSGGCWNSTSRSPTGAQRKSSGSDANGHWTAISCDWAGEPMLTTTVKHYSKLSATVYELAFPHGAKRTNVSLPGTATQRTQYGVTTKGVGPFAEFPSFDLAQGVAANASAFTWRGGLQYKDTWTGKVSGGFGFQFIANLTGLDLGPIVLFDESGGPSTPFPTAVVSPLSNINVAAMNVRNERAWSHGPSWELTSVPAGYTHSVLVVTGSWGIRNTLQTYGQFMLRAKGTTRLPDPSLKYLGVFTDNGAFYDAGWWPAFQNTSHDASQIFKNLSESYKQLDIPVHYIQLDDW